MRDVERPVTRVIVAGIIGLIVAGIGSAPGAGAGDSILFDNISPNGGLDGSGPSPASQIDPGFSFEAGAADDFLLPPSPLCTWSVTRVQWVGKYWGGSAPGAITGFRIAFWADVDGLPEGGGGPVPDLSKAIAVHDIAGNAGEAAEAGGVSGAFEYDAALPASVELQHGVRYWVQIQAVSQYPPQWGPHATSGRSGAGPVQYFDLLSLPAWSAVPGSGDLAFRLLGHPQSVACDDGNLCTTDACSGGECVFTPIVCDDGNACTANSCDPAVGCSAQPITCDDGDACTEDSCDPATGCQAQSITCNDGDPCTLDSCDPTGGCVTTAMDCGDDDACTTDVCQDGVCEHRAPPDLDGDGDVDLMDYAAVAQCLTTTAGVVDELCLCADLNGDGRMDLKDAALIQQAYTGSK